MREITLEATTLETAATEGYFHGWKEAWEAERKIVERVVEGAIRDYGMAATLTLAARLILESIDDQLENVVRRNGVPAFRRDVLHLVEPISQYDN